MSDHGYDLGEFQPGELLAIMRDRRAEVLTLHGMGLGIDQGRSVGSYRRLVAPLPSNQAQQSAFDQLVRLLRERPGSGSLLPTVLPHDGLDPLPKVLVESLLESGTAACEGTDEAREWLVAVWGHRGDWAAIADDIRFHCTSMQCATTASGQNQPVLLLHVLDDPERKSSFASWSKGALADKCQFATAHRVAQQCVFLPPDVTPAPESLGHFVEIARAAPGLFGLTQDAGTAERLLALLWAPSDGAPDRFDLALLPLTGLNFRDAECLTPPAHHYADMEVVTLRGDDAAMQGLQQEIEGLRDPPVGWRLELRTGYSEPPTANELRRRAQSLAAMKQEFDLLCTMTTDTPRLLRFADLRALAETVRCFSEDQLKQNRVLYGFQATADRRGWHYLLYEPASAHLDEVYLPLSAAQPGTHHERFWVDPLWARYYHDTERRHLVFTPQGTSLFPTPHAPDRHSVEQHLEGLLERLRASTGAAPPIPPRTLILFHGQPGPTAHLHVTLIARDDFKPLPDCLPWLNDNLVLETDLGIDAVIAQFADKQRRIDLIATTLAQCNAEEMNFDRCATETEKRLAERMKALLDLAAGEMNKRLVAHRANLDQLDALLTQTEDLQALLGQVEGARAAVKGEMDRATQALDDYPSQVAQLRTRVASAITASSAERKTLEQQIDTARKELENARRQQEYEQRTALERLATSLSQMQADNDTVLLELKNALSRIRSQPRRTHATS